MIIGELTAGVRIQLEKASSRHPISEDRQFREIMLKLLFYQMPKPAKRGGRDGPRGAHAIGRRGSPLAAPWKGVGALAHLWRSAFAYLIPQKPYDGESPRGNIPPPPRGGNHRERKSSPAGRNLPGKFLPGGGRSSPSSSSSRWTSSGSSSSSSPPPSPPSPLHHLVPL